MSFYSYVFFCFFSWVRFKMIILIAVFAGNHHCSHQVVYVLSFKFLVRTQTVVRSFLILAELPFNCGIFHWIQCGLWPCDDVLFSALGFSPRKPKPALTSIQWKPDYLFLMLLPYSSDFWKPLITKKKNTVQAHIKKDVCSLYFYMILKLKSVIDVWNWNGLGLFV